MSEAPDDYAPEQHDAAISALVKVAMMAHRLRFLGHQGLPADIVEQAGRDLSAALDELDRTDPSLFAVFAIEDHAWLDDLRRRGGPPRDPEGL